MHVTHFQQCAFLTRLRRDGSVVGRQIRIPAMRLVKVVET